jgi:hypothetical protein
MVVRQIMEEEMTRPPTGEWQVPLAIEINVTERWGGPMNVEKVREIGR